jgi:hypothetical protein
MPFLCGITIHQNTPSKMYNLAEQNERRARHWALLVTIVLHLALGIGLYLAASQPADKAENTHLNSTSKPQP